MSRRKRRSPVENSVVDNDDNCEESTESGDGSNEEPKCQHFIKSIDLNRLRKTVSKSFNNACTDCQVDGTATVAPEDLDSDDEIVPQPPRLWVCLQCGNIACGRDHKNHASKHFEASRTGMHYVVVDTQQWSVWCYKCDEDYVSNTKCTRQRKKLAEVKGLIERGLSRSSAAQPKLELPLCQNETTPMDNERKKIPTDLPKVGGLSNLGNTCFFNAVLQCLAQTPFLIQVLDDLQVPGQNFILPGGKSKVTDDEEVELAPIEGTLDNNITFTPVLRKTLVEMQNSNGQVYRPADLLTALRRRTMQCTDGGQHDSHELLRHLLEFVRNEDLKRYQSVILKETGLDEKSKRKRIDDNIRSHVKYYGNQANAKFLGPERVFRGELVSTLTCSECNHTSPRTEPFLDLSLPILIDKSLPTSYKRKSTGLENSTETASNNVSNTPKHEKKVNKAQRKKNKVNNTSTQNAGHINEERKGNESESDADVEDNIENEDASKTEVGESGYSSEKPSELASPISLSELHSTDKSSNFLSVTHLNYDFTSWNRNIANANCLPSPTDIEITDLTNNKNNEATTAGLSLPTSLIDHSDFTSPEGPTISPLSSPLTSKDSPTSPISSAIDGDEVEKVGKLVQALDNTSEKQDTSDKEDSFKKKNDSKDENLFSNKENGTTKKLTNGFGEIASNMSKLNLSSPTESPRRYLVKEGECSIQSCLNQFTVLEFLNGNNKVGCEACTQRPNEGKKGVKMVCTDSTKQYLISCVPAVLILHLKRFQVQKFSSRKVGKQVSFPMILDLSPVCKDYLKPRIYSLYGIVEHSGTMYGGHYVAYVKSRAPLKPDDPRWAFLPSKDGFENKDDSSESNSELENDEASGADISKIEPPPGRWYYVSDSRVSEVDEKTVLSSEAYLLFYERIL
ncbi:ubiquitin carboxyl-terminal hydrolase 16 isoform X2 [Copidosoma floridanum]|uniref:ubiquitin carboxyl-terminal hydrolase 16 isoform X2 n=1 Tax=Copidosoma floridanum TaxID=29053 RepID=UPI0006C9E2A3|nr:ubiquitin carboxyl-terminal hydrolase 16 isoform X2 [Copidosoma floridanum]